MDRVKRDRDMGCVCGGGVCVCVCVCVYSNRYSYKMEEKYTHLSLIPKECFSGAKSPGYFAVFGSVILLSFSQPVKEERQVQN